MYLVAAGKQFQCIYKWIWHGNQRSAMSNLIVIEAKTYIYKQVVTIISYFIQELWTKNTRKHG